MANPLEHLQDYYSAELDYLRKAGREFAEAHPKIARRLEFGEGQSPDPHIERLIESFAFLTGRVHARIDSLFPEVSSSLLSVVCPHLVRPVPSMAIARLMPVVDNIPPDGYTLPRGSMMYAQAAGGPECKFETSYETVLWPLEVTDSAIIRHSEFRDEYEFLKMFRQKGDRNSVFDSAALKLVVRAIPPKKLADLRFRSLRIFLNGGANYGRSLVRRLHEWLWKTESMLFRIGKRIVSRPAGYRPWPIRFPGFEPDEAALPIYDNALSGYRLLREYFSFPDKFHFVDVDLQGWYDEELVKDEESVEIYFLIRGNVPADLVTRPEHFQTNCVPVVNLFRRTTEPLRLDRTQTEYRLSPDLRREQTTEIYSVERVLGSTDPETQPAEYRPFFSLNHAPAMAVRDRRLDPSVVFWEARRRPSMLAGAGGTDIYLRFLDPDYVPAHPPNATLYAEALCTNRGLAAQIPERTELRFEVPGAPIDKSTCLWTRPTPQRDPPMDGEGLWRLISSLSLNHLSLAPPNSGQAESQSAKEALREILRIYANGDIDDENQILALEQVSSRPVSRRMWFNNQQAFVRGTEISIKIHEVENDPSVAAEAMILISVLERFFALYASVNSFTQVVLTGRKNEKEHRWPVRAGQRIVL